MDKEDQFYRSGIWILITLATSTFQVPKSKVSEVRSLPSRSSMEIWTYEISSLLLPFCKILQFPSVSLSYTHKYRLMVEAAVLQDCPQISQNFLQSFYNLKPGI